MVRMDCSGEEQRRSPRHRLVTRATETVAHGVKRGCRWRPAFSPYTRLVHHAKQSQEGAQPCLRATRHLYGSYVRGAILGGQGRGLEAPRQPMFSLGGRARVAVAPRARARLVGVFGGHVLARLLSSTGLNLSYEAPQAILPQLLTGRPAPRGSATTASQQRAASPT